MKASVKFFENGQVVKVENFRTKKEANKAINNYRTSVTVSERVKRQMSAYID
jgi:hypothetical protein